MDAEYPMDDNWFRERASAVATAQAKRMNLTATVAENAAMPVLHDNAIKAAFDAKTPDDAYALARELLMIAAKRQQAETTERAVAAAREGMGAWV